MTAGNRRGLRRTAVSALVIAGLAASTTVAADEDGAAARGKQIYFEGTSQRGTEIVAVVGDESVSLPASAVTCAGCHGSDGLGRPEGGILPPDIRWSELVKPYGHVHENGRRHGAYDDATFANSTIGGVDPAGNLLDRSMPMYRMSDADMADLVAYMKVLEHDADPGIDDSRVHVASLLPLRGQGASIGDAMARVMEAYFTEFNDAGGIYGRRIELTVIPLGESPEQSVAGFEQAILAGDVFATVGAYTIGLDEALLDIARDARVPMVGPFTLDPGDAFLDESAFYVYSGFEEQARVLVRQALGTDVGKRTLVIVAPEDGRGEKLVRAVQTEIRAEDAGAAATVERYAPGDFDPVAFAEKVRERDAVLFLGPQGDLRGLLSELVRRQQTPDVYLVSSLLSAPLYDAPAVFDRRIHIAYPTLASDLKPEGISEYRALAARYSLPPEHVQAQIERVSRAARLRRAGRDLSRERFVAGLEQLYNFDTGVTPLLTYGPNRRIGARGAHIMVVDLEARSLAAPGESWHELR